MGYTKQTEGKISELSRSQEHHMNTLLFYQRSYLLNLWLQNEQNYYLGKL